MNNHVVYIIKDKFQNIMYVGEGRPDRPKSKSGRNKAFLDFIKNEVHFIEIVQSDLSKLDAQILEQKLINDYDPLLNKNNTCFVNVLTLKFCKEHFYIDFSSPTLLRWNKDILSGEYRNVYSAKKHDPAGGSESKGYLRVQVNSKTYKLHRILWCLYNNEDLPVNKVINHIDSNRSNNLPNNLEACSQSENIRRVRRLPNNKSGIVGVSTKVSKDGIISYYATVRYNGKLYEKGFSSKKYGDEVAKQKAITWRNAKIIELSKDEYGIN